MKIIDQTAYAAVLMVFLAGASTIQADELLKPYVLVSNKPGDIAEVQQRTEDALTAQGFQIVGEYSPYEKARVIVISHDDLKTAASKTAAGAYGAVQRVTLTQVGDNVQVAHTNPRYMANAFRMADELVAIETRLAAALGSGEPYGATGLSATELRKYHYKFMMPYFDEPYELGRFDSHETAVEAVEAGLKSRRGGVSKVYRVDLPGTTETVFGVHMSEGCSSDQYIMDRIDFAAVKSTPHLPYEVLVSGHTVYALATEFRIAQSFPDLSMVGANSFFSIMCAPDAIKGALTAVIRTTPATIR